MFENPPPDRVVNWPGYRIDRGVLQTTTPSLCSDSVTFSPPPMFSSASQQQLCIIRILQMSVSAATLANECRIESKRRIAMGPDITVENML
jgi:hypothetical protein